MGGIFNSQNKGWQFIGLLGDLLILSLLWLVCSFPILTLGASTAALYDAAARGIREKATLPYVRFFKTLKAELLRSIPSTLLWLLVLALGLLGIRGYALSVSPGAVSYVTGIAALVLMLLPLGAACWAFPLLSRFTFNFVGLNVTAIKLAVAQLPRTIVLALSAYAFVWLCLRLVLPVFFLPALLALGWSYIIEPVFKKYQ